MGEVQGRVSLRNHQGVLQQSTDGGSTWVDAGSGGTSGFVTVLARAQSLLGPTIVKAFGTDFDTTNWIATPTVANTGTGTLSTTQRGGVLECKTGATGASSVLVRPVGLGGIVINPTTELWYMRNRLRVATAIDAQAYLTGAMASTSGPGPGVFFGAIGARSTANFAFEIYNNAGALQASGSLGVALDTNFHVFEMWGDATNFRIAIDGAIVNTTAIPATTTNPCTWRVDALNQGTAANREIHFDDVVICTAG